MTKTDLVECLVKDGMARSTAMDAVDGIVKHMARILANGDSIYLRGLATFKIVTAKQKVARDISKGTSIVIPAHRKVKLILSKQLKNKLK